MSRPLAGPSPLGGPSPRPGPSPRTGPSPLGGPSPRPINGPSPRTAPSPRAAPSPVASSGAAAVAQRNLSTPTRPSPVSLAGPSPQGSSPSALKRGAGPADKQRDPKKPKLAPGPSWIVDKVEVMQQQYKGRVIRRLATKPDEESVARTCADFQDALIAATMILQYQADSRAIGYKSKTPRKLELRLETAWRNYDAVRRQVEWFIAQNVEYAAAPEKFMKARPPPLPLAPMTLPTPSPSIPAHMQGNTPKAAAAASPIQLGAASLLSNQPAPPASASVPGGFPEGLLDGSLNLDGMNMEELNAFIGGAQNGNVNGGNDMNMPQQMQVPDVPQNTDNPPDQTAMTPNTSNLLNTLQGNTTDAAQNPQAQSQPPQPAGDFEFNFGENGGVDLTSIDLSAFDDLFPEDSTVGDAMGAPGSAPDATAPAPANEEKKDDQPPAATAEQPAATGDQSQTQNGQQQQQQQQPQEQQQQQQPTPQPPQSASPQKPATPAQPAQPAQPPAESAPPAQPAPDAAPPQPAPVPVAAAATEPAPVPDPVPVPVPEPEQKTDDTSNGLGGFDTGNGIGDMDLNFDDFNFGDIIPDVNDPDFESMFAEFE
ncbi:hypothetical protein A1Q1_04956 [Trichosporon asahii var. asahii CBS 2479]|uniref:Uncharacterized protein n=1 Tax=Trichosporon asahii var. asahii (strain ATCC 90039 / CBS 2479 / JCM 2466 / KCTC 7840 / NBRC 103889/ NCYC 2677 / UAMH 7654) TaxID=1186058 RepID=J6EUK4_TRIAS|nr:hypothetical protein A1Q1_04956 [Trichosporon asahii var. asahii CBS 2479]EJT46467.1 hypothetical protein A1Q1_04956 [Trichosporon asahii var. asahii CBS 2479]